jgi:capsular polysaccharide biosynthesis protein
MTQQTLDLRRSVQLVRRHRKLFAAIVALGLFIGAAYAVLRPPALTSTALVVISTTSAQSAQAASPGPDGMIATQMVIASSDSVLLRALPRIQPAVSLSQLQQQVHVSSEAGSILSISASAKAGAQAEAMANAVADSYVAYVHSKNSPVGHVPAGILQSATTATGPKLPQQVTIYALLGALAGALIGLIVSVAIGRNNRRLVERDAIANSIAAPVLASIPVGQPSDPASWAKLLEEYQPEVVDAWRLTRLLHQFGVADDRAGAPGDAGGSSLNVLSLSSDPRALALGPQLAAFAAAQGIPTALVVGPQQDMNLTATLRTACMAPPQAQARRRPLRLIASDDARLGQLRAAFVVVVTVIDSRDPRVPDTVRTAATVLGVSAGSATAEELARAATAAAADGREIVGIIVANPAPDDQTTGRVARLTPPLRRSLPTRATGTPMEIRQ